MAEKILKTGTVCCFAREHKTTIALDPWHLHHGGFRVGGVEVARVSMLQRHPFDAAVEVIRPTVIAAGEFAGVAVLRRHHERAAMGALIVDDMDTLIPVAD